MRRRDFTKLALAGATGAVAAPAVVRAQAATFNWKMTSFYGPNAAFYSTGPGSAKDLIKRIEEMSGGRIKIQFYGAGELIPAAEGFDAVSTGTVEMNYANALLLDRQGFRRRSISLPCRSVSTSRASTAGCMTAAACSSGRRSTTASIWCRSCAATPACR